MVIQFSTSCAAEGGIINANALTPEPGPINFHLLGQNNGVDILVTEPEKFHQFTMLANGVYTLTVGLYNDPADNSEVEITISCNVTPPEPPTDDLTVTLNTTDPTAYGLANGSVTLNIATSHPPFNTKLDGMAFIQGLTVYNNLAAGDHVAYVVDAAGFTRELPFTLSQPDPEPPGPANYYAVGGVLPNPVFFTLNFDPVFSGNPKINHFLNVEVLTGTTVIDTLRQRVRNGVTKLDVSAYLKRELSLNNTASLLFPEDEVLPFSIRYQENYNGITGTWQTDDNPRYAVQAALDAYSSDFNAYVVRAPYNQESEEDQYYKFLTSFDKPIKWACHGTFLTTIIDESLRGSVTNLYFERSYYASDGTLVERRSDLIPEEYYGQLLRLQIQDDVLPCANYVDCVITDFYQVQEGICEPNTPPPVGLGVFDESFDNSYE